MRVPFAYQTTEYDCVPTTVLNAIRALFERWEIPPEVVTHLWLYTLDTMDRQGRSGTRGSSDLATRLLTQWLDVYANPQWPRFNVRASFIAGPEVHLGPGSRILACLREGGVAATSVRWGTRDRHYTLALAADDRHMWFFDPYLDEPLPITRRWPRGLFQPVDRGPRGANLRVDRVRVDMDGDAHYAFGHHRDRDAVLLRRITSET